MTKGSKIVALVPMRHESERVPGKNYRLFAGKPLYHYILESLLACPLVAEVVINTDSRIIMEGVSQYFPQVRLIERPDYLRGGSVPMNEILIYDVQQVEADYYLQTHSTNPLLQAGTISRAIQRFLASYPGHDSLFSVTRVQSRFWDESGRPINHDPKVLLRTQDLPPVYEENSCIYLFTRPILEKRRSRIGERPFLFKIERHEAWDIDEEIDFQIAEFLYLKRQGG
ncbi:MAG: acylneuraminate cytidylyltransferase family protein [Deltaproteobacteria bacterium]|nr:MAG: acylneuraminate cytidylyltransferase family protein [Deltaproteobacteria bacterium]